MSDEQNNNNGEGQNGGTDGQEHNSNNSGENSNGNNAQNNGTPSNNGDRNANAGLSQEQYEKRIAELDTRDKAIDEKYKKMLALNDKITAEGRASGGTTPETKEETQKKEILKNFADCIPGLDKMI